MIEVERGGHDAVGWNGEKGSVRARGMQRIAIRWQPVRLLGEMKSTLHDTDRARIKGAWMQRSAGGCKVKWQALQSQPAPLCPACDAHCAASAAAPHTVAWSACERLQQMVEWLLTLCICGCGCIACTGDPCCAQSICCTPCTAPAHRTVPNTFGSHRSAQVRQHSVQHACALSFAILVATDHARHV